MKRLFTVVSNLLTAVALAAPTANEDFVLAEDAKTYTNAVSAAKDYTDAAVASATPADYETVSNRAMSAVQFDLDVNSNRTALTVGTDRQGNIGAHSVAFGNQSSATGSYSFAHGSLASAYADFSHAEGFGTIASGKYSHAEGEGTQASGNNSHAEGGGSVASGNDSHAEGCGSTASGDFSHAEGFATTASGYASHAEGESTVAGGANSHADGIFASATHNRSYVWGGIGSYDAGQTSKGVGTYCIYPFGGISGFFVGGQSLDDIIHTQTDAAISSATNGLASVSSVASVSSDLGDHIADRANPHGVTAAQVGALTKTQGDAAYYPKSEGDLWAAWWSGDGFRVTVTNYNVAPSEDIAWARLPSAKFEYRPDGETTNELRVVWDEETKWRRWRGEFAATTNDIRAALDAKAGVDWGATTPTGFYAPAGFTWLDTPATVIAGGLAWQKTITSEGAFWVLSSNGMIAQFGAPGASTNGYFRITDERGNAVFEIVAGDKVTVGANAASVHHWQHTDGRTRLRVVYEIDSDKAPTLYAAKALVPGGATDWKEVGTEGCAALAAGWTGQRGAWTNALWLATAPASADADSLFVCATYERGGETVVKNHAAVSMDKLVLGGKTYAVGTATVDGHTVLTLTEVK